MADTSGLPGKIVYAGRNCVIHYEPKLSDFAEIAMGPELLSACMEEATVKALPYAIEISPRGPSGTYVRSWKVVPDTWTSRKTRLRRVVAKLVNTSPWAANVEWGDELDRGKGQHILRAVLEHLSTGADADLDDF